MIEDKTLGNKYQIKTGDCLKVLKEISDASVDMVLADLPYGTTQSKWDSVIPFEPLWNELNRICKHNAAIAMFGSEPFSSYLRLSNIKQFKYDWVWNKRKCSGFLNAKRRPLVMHEVISMFYAAQPIFNAQFHTNKLRRDFTGKLKKNDPTTVYGKQREYISEVGPDKACPRSIIEQTAVVNNSSEKVAHPNQKPVALLEYLIKTYTNEGDTVLDPTMGSGSTGVACINTGRKFIGIEQEPEYVSISKARLEHSLTQHLKKEPPHGPKNEAIGSVE